MITILQKTSVDGYIAIRSRKTYIKRIIGESIDGVFYLNFIVGELIRLILVE